jgi:hypothetical protein
VSRRLDVPATSVGLSVSANPGRTSPRPASPRPVVTT